jgi:hypothetical protein
MWREVGEATGAKWTTEIKWEESEEGWIKANFNVYRAL